MTVAFMETLNRALFTWIKRSQIEFGHVVVIESMVSVV